MSTYPKPKGRAPVYDDIRRNIKHIAKECLQENQAKYNVITALLIFTRVIIAVSLETTSSKHKQKQKHMNSDYHRKFFDKRNLKIFHEIVRKFL